MHWRFADGAVMVVEVSVVEVDVMVVIVVVEVKVSLKERCGINEAVEVFQRDQDE